MFGSTYQAVRRFRVTLSIKDREIIDRAVFSATEGLGKRQGLLEQDNAVCKDRWDRHITSFDQLVVKVGDIYDMMNELVKGQVQIETQAIEIRDLKVGQKGLEGDRKYKRGFMAALTAVAALLGAGITWVIKLGD